MRTFPVVSPLLRELDVRGSAVFGADWNTKVIEAIRDLRNRYTQLRMRDRKLIDYSSLPVQMAYAFMYVGANANCLFQVMKAGSAAFEAQSLSKPDIQVTSLGGGPGSDLLALVGMLRTLSPDVRPRRVRYRVLDKQPNWHEILGIVARLQQGTVEIDVSFEAVDVTIPDQWRGVSCNQDDLLIMNFFVSEVCSLKEARSVRDCLTAQLASLSAGSALVFNDSNAFTFHDYFDKLYRSVGGFSAIASQNEQLTVPPDFDEFFNECMARFDATTPKLTSNAAFRVLVRK